MNVIPSRVVIYYESERCRHCRFSRQCKSLISPAWGRVSVTHSTSLTPVRPSIRHSEDGTGAGDLTIVTRGGDVSLQCAADGVPRPAVTWLKDGRPIVGQQHGGGAAVQVLNEGRLLHIKNARVSDTGRYTCIAVNVAGQADRRHDVSVHGTYAHSQIAAPTRT